MGSAKHAAAWRRAHRRASAGAHWMQPLTAVLTTLLLVTSCAGTHVSCGETSFPSQPSPGALARRSNDSGYALPVTTIYVVRHAEAVQDGSADPVLAASGLSRANGGIL